MENCLSIFNTLSTMRELSAEEKLKVVSIMLRYDALNKFSSNSSRCDNFEAAMTHLRSWYNIDDQSSRIRARWQNMRLSTEIGKEPDESEVTVFHKFVSDLISLQKQLDVSYHDDRFLRDRLLAAVDLPSVQATLRDRITRNSQQAINSIAIQLSE